MKNEKWLLFAVVMKIISGKNSGKLVSVHMLGESEEQLKSLIVKSGLKPIVISKEW